MNLTLQSQCIAGVAVIRCQGRIVVGAEVQLLQAEVEKYRLETKNYVLQLGEVSYVDSGGLGALVRLAGTLRAQRGDVKLCQVSPFVQNVLKATNLLGLFPIYASEKEALTSFISRGGRSAPVDDLVPCHTVVLCIDPSSDLLAYVTAVLKCAGFEVKTTRYLADASTLLAAMKPRAIVCGPGVQSTTPAFEKFRRLGTSTPFLLLPPDFHTSDASDAGLDLVNRLQALLPA
jgi:anti-sigma B factor antagonist